jgi:hypothetical protein
MNLRHDARVRDERRRSDDGESIVAPLSAVERPVPARAERERDQEPDEIEPSLHSTMKLTILPGT